MTAVSKVCMLGEVPVQGNPVSSYHMPRSYPFMGMTVRSAPMLKPPKRSALKSSASSPTVIPYREGRGITPTKLEKAGLVNAGGAGVYAFDGPESCKSYAHFDARGYLTRWGTLRKRAGGGK